MRGISCLATEPFGFSRRTLFHGVSKYTITDNLQLIAVHSLKWLFSISFCKLDFSSKDNFYRNFDMGESFLSCRQYDILLSGTILPIIAGLACNRNDLTKVGYGRISNCVRRSVWSLGFLLRTGAKVRLRKLVEFRRPDKFRFLKCVYVSSVIMDCYEIQLRNMFLYWDLVSSAVGCVCVSDIFNHCLEHIALQNFHLVRRLGILCVRLPSDEASSTFQVTLLKTVSPSVRIGNSLTTWSIAPFGRRIILQVLKKCRYNLESECSLQCSLVPVPNPVCALQPCWF
jgi:hypothetical protein